MGCNGFLVCKYEVEGASWFCNFGWLLVKYYRKTLISICLFNVGICLKEIVLKLTVPFHSIFNRGSSSDSLFRMSGLLDRLIVNEIQITNFIRITNIHTHMFVAVNTNKSDSYRQHLSYYIIEYFKVKILLQFNYPVLTHLSSSRLFTWTCAF